MKSLRIASLLFLLVIGPVLSSYSQNIYLNYPLHIYYKNNKYDCSITPPINADSTQMRCIMFSWTPYGGYYDGAHNDFKLSEQEISVKSIGDTVWLKMINLVPSNNTKDGIKTWIRGIKEGDRIRFKDTEPIGHSRYDLHEYEYVIIMDSLGNYDSVRMDTDSIIGKCDTIYQKSVTVGEKSETRVENHSWWGSFKYAEWPFEYCNMDIIAEYNPDTGLIKYPDHELLVRPLHQYYPAERDYPYITNWALRDEMAIKDFIITRGFATKEPISLPAPEVTYYKKSSWAGHGGMYISDLWIKCNIYMDLITEDGEVLDRS